MNNLLCPLCNKNDARVSSTYREAVVCNCSGKCEEVGTFDYERNMVVSNKPKETKSALFKIRPISNVDEILRLGKVFNNGLSDSQLVEYYLSLGSEIYVAKFREDENHKRSLMFYIKNKVAANFVLKNNLTPMIEDIEYIKDKLRKAQLID